MNRLKERACLLPHPMIIYVNTPSDATYVQKCLKNYGFTNQGNPYKKSNTGKKTIIALANYLKNDR